MKWTLAGWLCSLGYSLSLTNLILLLGKRSYLYAGQIEDCRPMLFPAFASCADSALAFPQSQRLWLTFRAMAEMAAWVGPLRVYSMAFVADSLDNVPDHYLSFDAMGENAANGGSVYTLFILIGFIYGFTVGAARRCRALYI